MTEPQREEVAACYFCHGTNLHILHAEVRDRTFASRETWRFLRCQGCSTAILSPRPTPESLAGYYPEQYMYDPAKPETAFQALVAKLEYALHFRWIYRTQANIVQFFMRQHSIKGKRILDIGCGSGLLLHELSRCGFEVEGTDLRDSTLSYARNKLGLKVTAMDTADIPHRYSPASFDVVMAFHVLEHLPDPLESLKQWRRLIKPGGLLILGLPMVDGLQAGWFGARWANFTEAPRHLCVPSQPGVQSICQEAGFADVGGQADGLMHSAGVIALSMFPGGGTAHQRSKSPLMPMLKRLAAAVTTLLALPVIYFENRLMRRPSMMIFAARNA